MMEVEIIYLHKRNFEYKTNRGLSEKLVKNYYSKKGYLVWKGEYLRFLGNESFYVYQKEKYDKLIYEIKSKIGTKRFWKLIIYLKAFSGIPDFIIKKNEELIFVEVKLNNESIKKNQLNSMLFLKEIGLNSVIVRVSDNKRIFKKELDLLTGKSYLKSYIPKLRLKW